MFYYCYYCIFSIIIYECLQIELLLTQMSPVQICNSQRVNITSPRTLDLNGAQGMLWGSGTKGLREVSTSVVNRTVRCSPENIIFLRNRKRRITKLHRSITCFSCSLIDLSIVCLMVSTRCFNTFCIASHLSFDTAKPAADEM